MRKVYVDTGRTTEKKEYESFTVENSFVQVYIDVGELVFKISSPMAIHLLIWAVSNMDRYNQIHLNKANRSEFISECRTRGSKYTDGSVKFAIRKLQIANAIVSMNERSKREALYMINPSYFWKTKSQNDRIDAIRGYRYQLKNN